MLDKIISQCLEKNIKITDNREIILRVICEANDHPDIDEVLRRANLVNSNIGIATVYRTLKLLEEAEIITKHEFGTNKAHYEIAQDDEHHDHLIDVETGKIHEFFNTELEDLKHKIAKNMGYEMIAHRLELYCKPLKGAKSAKSKPKSSGKIADKFLKK